MIPIENLYFMLCYAWGRLEERDLVDVAALPHKDLPNLLARVLANGSRRLLKMGLDREYLEIVEDTSSIRGKINLGSSIKRLLFEVPRMTCITDELSRDVIHNQILKATLRDLSRSENVAPSIKHELRILLRGFHDIADISVQKSMFEQIKLHRNNAFYGFLLDVCRFVYDLLLPNQQQGSYRMRDFFRDEVRMRKVFEDFVFHYLATEQQEFSVSRKKVKWSTEGSNDQDLHLLPEMRTDVFLRSGDRHIIVETKYTPRFFQEHRGKKSLRSEHLYQLLTYLSQSFIETGIRPDGILLYPATSGKLTCEYQISGMRMRVIALDLSKSWESIVEEMSLLLG